MKKPWVLSYPLSAQQRVWSDWADAQADLSLCSAHSHFVGFVMRQLKYIDHVSRFYLNSFLDILLTIIKPKKWKGPLFQPITPSKFHRIWIKVYLIHNQFSKYKHFQYLLTRLKWYKLQRAITQSLTEVKSSKTSSLSNQYSKHQGYSLLFRYCNDPNFRTDMPGQTVQTLKEQSDQGLLCLPSVCIFWAHYSMVEPHSPNFRVITTNILGVRIFRKFTVHVSSCNEKMQRTINSLKFCEIWQELDQVV